MQANEQRVEPFIDGYFSRRIAAGERPDYGYPKNHLPDTSVKEMEVETGFMAAFEKK